MEKRKRSAALMHIVVGLFLIFKTADYITYTKNDFTTVLPFLAIALLSILYGLFRRRVDPEGNYNQWIRFAELMAFVVLGALLISTERTIDYIGCFVMAAIAFMLWFSERRIYKDHELLITEEGVVIPGDFKLHTVPWNVLSDVVIRHDFITIFHNDEKYLQYQVLQTLSELEVAKMNGFCREKIESSVVNRES